MNERKRIKKRIKKLKAEEEALMKNAQGERFQEGKFSGFVYKIRMEKYSSRLNEIKQKLPVQAHNQAPVFNFPI